MNGNRGGEGDDDLKMDGAAGCIPAEAMVQLRGLLSEKEWIHQSNLIDYYCDMSKLFQKSNANVIKCCSF